MKLLRLLLAASLLTSFFTSCSSDDETTPDDNEITNSITIGDDTFTFTEVEISDLGATNPFGFKRATAPKTELDELPIKIIPVSYSHYGYSFYIYDENDDFKVSFTLYSPGNTQFQTGTFEFVNEDDSESTSDIDGEYILTYGKCYDYTDTTSTSYYNITGGSVTITELDPTEDEESLQIQLNLTFDALDDYNDDVVSDQGTSYTFKYEGDFDWGY